MLCPHCQTQLSLDARFCPRCGNACQTTTIPLSQHEQLAAVVGPNNANYLPGFLAREDGKSAALSWHWPACLVTFFWMLYRKMYGPAFIYLAIALILANLVAPLIATALGALGVLVAVLIYLALFIVPALFAREWYRRHSLKVIASAATFSRSPNQQLDYLRHNGGTSPAGYIVPIVLLAGSVPIIGILAAVAIPAYQDYVNRASTQQAYQSLQHFSQSIDRYYGEHQQLPATLAQAGIDAATVSHIELQLLGDGSLQATLLRSAQKGKSLQLQPVSVVNGALVWQCQSSEIADRHLPVACREQEQ